MKSLHHARLSSQGMTLLEMSMVIMILLSLIGVGFTSSKALDEWKLGRAAAESLRSVSTAQRMYLADNPTVLVANITAANIIPYLPNGVTTMPTVKSLTDTTLSILVNQSPPVVNNGSGGTYDPSGKPNDSLWDIGK